MLEFAAHAPGQEPPQLELRVHGVSGTPPEDLLARPLVEQVAGDRIAGFYRPREALESRDDRAASYLPARPDAPQLEGYSWGGLTSGSPGRALWLLLLPFTLVNLAPRARPPAPAGRTWPAALVWFLCRLLALLLTLLFVLAALGIGDDLIGWQCAGDSARCARATPHALFARLVTGHRLSAEHTVLVGTVVPVLTVGLLWLVSTRTANRYERTVADLTGYRARVDGDARGPETPLASAAMWRNEWPVRRLRAVHLQAAFALIVWTLAAPTRAQWTGIGCALVAGWALVAPALPGFSGRAPSPGWQRASRAVWAVVAALGAVQLVGYLADRHWLTGAFLTTPERGRQPVGPLPYFGLTVLVEFTAALGVLVLLIGVVAVAAARRDRGLPPPPHRPLRPGAAGTLSAVFAALGVFLAAAFSAGVYTYAAAFLHTGSLKPGFGDVSRIYQFFVVPEAVRSASQAFAWAVLVAAVVVVATAVVAVIVYARRPQALGPAGALEHDYPAAQVAADPARAHGIRQAIFLGRVVDLVPWVVGPLVAAGTVIAAVFAGQALVVHQRDRLAGVGPPPGFFSTYSLRGAGAYFAVLTLLGLVALGSLAFRVPTTRRAVGILWDVASFWPRLGHPLAPPCYAERTVPDLVTRISAYRVADPQAALVLAAHSQGTVIGAAALEQLATFDTAAGKLVPTSVLPGVGFLSCGTVLRRLYGRYFPVYFGPARLAALEALLTTPGAAPRWRNLWRYTDYLGGQVTAGPAPVVPAAHAPVLHAGVLPEAPPVTGPAPWEWHAPDPPLFARAAGDTTYSAPGRHSDFWSDPSGCFQLAAADLVGQIRAEGPDRADPPPTPPPAGGPGR